MGIEAGRLRHFINIQTPTEQRDPESGSFTKTWADLYTNIDAAIEDSSVKGYLQSRADQSEVSSMIIIRHIPDLNSAMRFVGVCGCHQGKIYNPVGQLGDKETGIEYLTFPCSEGVNDG